MLVTLPDGSHRNVPDPERILRDIDSLVAPRVAGRADGPLEPANYIEVDLGGGLYFFRYDIHEGRGVFAQDGTFDENHADFSDGSLVYDAPGKGRHPFKAGYDPLNGPTQPWIGRLQGGQFLGFGIITMTDINTPDRIFKYTDSYDPAVSLVTGFTRPAGAGYLLCSSPVQINGAAWYAFGWSGATANSLQIISNLNNPPTASTIPTGTGPIWGLTQTPIDDNALAIYMDDATGGLLNRIGMLPALGATSLEPGKRLPGGGTSVGMVNLEGSPDLFFVCPAEGAQIGASQGAPGFTDVWRYKHQLLRTDLRCSFGPQIVDIKLPNIVWATGMGNALAYCAGGRHHRWMTRGADVPIPGTDRPPFSAGSYEIRCVGHHRRGDKFFWTENEVDMAGVRPTLMRRFEYDPLLRRAWPITPKISLGTLGIRGIGGNEMPVSLTGNLIDYQDGWRWQFQPPTGTLGTELMHVDGAGATSGREFESSSYRTTPRLRSRRHPNARFAGARLTGPTLSQLRRGTSYDSSEALVPEECRIEVSCNLFPETVIFRATEVGATEDYRPVYPLPASDDWQPFVQLTYTAYRGSTGTYAARYSPVVDHMTVEGYFYDPAPPPPSSNYPTWGGGIEPPGNMSESLTR